MLCSRAELMKIFGFSRTKVDNLARQGLPVHTQAAGRGAAHIYDTVAVFGWLLNQARGDDLHGERTRLTRAQAERAEIENERIKERLLDRDEVIAGVERIFVALRARLLAIPSKFAPLVAGHTAPEVREILDREVRICMQDMADFEINADGSEKTTTHASVKADRRATA